ncbi:MAG TPA: efflux RND transporter periplasmic adaptor subunit [Lysobacter sp.]|nr:efflux RND transporter periplasmic adaptor subunit [Lysobacter sp.]
MPASTVSRLALLLLVLALGACGGDPAPVEVPRPVLAVRPTAAGHAVRAYAAEVRAREESVLGFRIGGSLVERRVDVGDRVRAGQVLAVVDPRDVAQQAGAARAQLAAAEAQLVRARAERQRIAALAREQLVSRSALDSADAALAAAQGQAEAARAQAAIARNQAAYAQLRAPRDGVIARRDAEVGQVVAPGQAVFALAADGAREVAFAVPEDEAGALSPGMPVEVELWSQPGRRWPGRVREVAPAADSASRTFAVRATVQAPNDVLALGQSARVYRNGAGTGLQVPLSALQRGANGPAVWVVDGRSGRARLRPVRIGAYGEDAVPVLDGLRPDELVVAAGGHLLREGQPVRPVDRDNRPLRAATPVAGR